ncbi:hypothetical protein PHLCEN_2v10373 [Hermanssonia centrifuga]|uniref:Uncharacterized protein n=1 Tax=Hermanssonia centrifuga TaxID=98765 RepID=A0A2R6NP28_9APHY|nr:hypothetical protein PHLCEN_2v10373 [Hermanssonia centrifuga]
MGFTNLTRASSVPPLSSLLSSLLRQDAPLTPTRTSPSSPLPLFDKFTEYQGSNTMKATLAFDTLRGLSPYLTLLANLATQLVCVSGVNQLTSRVSSVSTNLVLTTRKALSLLFSVWWFGNGWNDQLGLGAGFVFAGSIIYTTVASASSNSTSTKPSSAENPAGLNSPGNVKTESPTPARTIPIKREDSIRIPFTPPQPNQKANWKEEDTDDDDNTNTNGPGGHNMLTRRRVHKMEFAETELDLDDGLRGGPVKVRTETRRLPATRRRIEGTVSGGDEQGPEDEDGADRGGEQGPEGEPRELYNGTGVRRGEVLPTLTGDDSGWTTLMR